MQTGNSGGHAVLLGGRPAVCGTAQLQRGQQENHVLAFDVSKAFDTALHGALALLLRHMGVLEELITLFHTLSCSSTVCNNARSHSEHPPPSTLKARQHGNRRALPPPPTAPLAEPCPQAQGDACHAVPPLVQAYCDDLLLTSHSLTQFLEYATAIVEYLADMGMSLNVGKCAYCPTTRTPSIIVHLDPNNAVTPWVCLVAKSTVPYLGLKLDPKRMASMKEKRVLRCEALLGSCNNTLGPASIPHEVMAAPAGGIVRYAAP